jgi:hypothetical protein
VTVFVGAGNCTLDVSENVSFLHFFQECAGIVPCQNNPKPIAHRVLQFRVKEIHGVAILTTATVGRTLTPLSRKPTKRHFLTQAAPIFLKAWMRLHLRKPFFRMLGL